VVNATFISRPNAFPWNREKYLVCYDIALLSG
jgi:hypothetical protein